ncbi:hypothetical protein O9G_006052 [Rozella allomycis CSF55]|uniref:Reverse transcriptase Ty1/copia-type domain-containing protein n=1 Tax=Rozella allomycis (strain CSF55) TaxID=988480 RepID=A0A075AXW9_ROZAC|nr:hypothetical protein O9G_006052 [Rozella allomycis CSF55]|eukprot:EPZ35135.1 hypothetical protein O9G_006052 [Rozella allomycis CSF55]
MVAQLLQSHYGLHQASSEWFKTFSQYLSDSGLIACKSEPCMMMYRYDSSGKLLIVLICVDDILLISNNTFMISGVKEIIKSKFDIKDIGIANWILKICCSK